MKNWGPLRRFEAEHEAGTMFESMPEDARRISWYVTLTEGARFDVLCGDNLGWSWWRLRYIRYIPRAWISSAFPPHNYLIQPILSIYVLNSIELFIPRAPMTSIFEGQPPKTRPNFQTKTRGSIWVPGVFVCIIISWWLPQGQWMIWLNDPTDYHWSPTWSIIPFSK